MMRCLLVAGFVFSMAFVTAVPTPAKKGSVEDEVLAVEQARGDALIHQDYAALDKVLADDLIFVHGLAIVDSKEALVARLRAGTLQYFSSDSTQLHARVLGKVAVLNGPVVLKLRNSASDQPRTLRLQATVVYAKRDGRWQLISYQTTTIPTPEAK